MGPVLHLSRNRFSEWQSSRASQQWLQLRYIDMSDVLFVRKRISLPLTVRVYISQASYPVLTVIMEPQNPSAAPFNNWHPLTSCDHIARIAVPKIVTISGSEGLRISIPRTSNGLKYTSPKNTQAPQISHFRSAAKAVVDPIRPHREAKERLLELEK